MVYQLLKECGTNICSRANKLKQLGYNVLILIDSDNSDINKEIDESIKNGVKVIQWNEFVSTEERIFLDTPKEKIQDLINTAIEINGEEKIRQKIKQETSIDTIDYKDIELILGENESRKKLGKIFKSKDWFKRIDKGELLGDFIRKNYDSFDSNKDIIKKLEQVREWAYNEI